MAVDYGSLPFAEALAFFRRKLALPTQRWDDLLGAAHDRAFVIAGAMQADLLMDLKNAVDRAMAEGQTLETFRNNFEQIVAARGWTGWAGSDSQAGHAWRARIIYDTNLFTAYAAGRYQQMQAVKKTRPYWQYHHSDAVTHPRVEHQAWSGKLLPADDPWWRTHYPPCGFGCQCYVSSHSQRDVQRMGVKPITGEQMPYNGTVEHVDPRTGEITRLPQGVDKGWDYAPGANRNQPLVDLIRQKQTGWPAALGAAVVAALLQSTSPDLAEALKTLMGGR